MSKKIIKYASVVVVLIIISINWIPIKYGILTYDLSETTIYVEPTKSTDLYWYRINGDTYEEICLKGNAPDIPNYYVHNQNNYICYGYFDGINDIGQNVFVVNDWDIVAPIKRAVFRPEWYNPKNYLVLWDFIRCDQ